MIFFDCSIPISIPRALKSLGLTWVYYHHEFFPDGTPDSVWLTRAAQEGWTVLTRDKKVRTRPSERAIIMDYGIGCFIINANKALTRWEYMKLFAITLERMKAYATTSKPPFIVAVNRDGSFKRVG